MTKANEESKAKIFLKLSLTGEPRRVLMELRKKGYVRSYSSAVCLGLLELWNKIVERELKEAQLRASKHLQE